MVSHFAPLYPLMYFAIFTHKTYEIQIKSIIKWVVPHLPFIGIIKTIKCVSRNCFLSSFQGNSIQWLISLENQYVIVHSCHNGTFVILNLICNNLAGIYEMIISFKSFLNIFIYKLLFVQKQIHCLEVVVSQNCANIFVQNRPS